MRARTWAALGFAALMTAGCGVQDDPDSQEPAAASHHDASSSTARADADTDVAALAGMLATTRLATAKYVTDLDLARADGYQVITPTIPGMGVHFLNPDSTDFDPAAPPILVYAPTADGPQLAALEWVFPEEPAEPPLPGATYGEFAAACHFADGTFVPTDSEEECAEANPDTGSTFTFWHGPLVTLHVWLWYHNPDGLFAGTNPLVAPFNAGTLAMTQDGR